MRIAIGNDHAAIEMKKTIQMYLEEKGHEVINCGVDTPGSTDYPLYGKRVVAEIINHNAQLGIAICGTGVGMSLVCNKHKGIRAVCCSEPYSARLSRMHNDANVVCFGARVVGAELAKMIVDEFLSAQFIGGHHQKRLDMIKEIEDQQ